MDNIYKALGYLKPEEQESIIANYKLPELYNIFANTDDYEKYIKDLFAVSDVYVKRALALSALHTEALLQSMKKEEKVDIVDSMSKVYDLISKQDKKIFCERLLQKKEFFTDAYKVIAGYFERAVKELEDNLEDGIADNNVEEKQKDS